VRTYLQRVLGRFVLDGDDALHPEDVVALLLPQQVGEPRLELVQLEVALHREVDRHHRVVVQVRVRVLVIASLCVSHTCACVMRATDFRLSRTRTRTRSSTDLLGVGAARGLEVGVDVQRSGHVKGVDVEDAVEVDLGPRGSHDGGRRVVRQDLPLERLEVVDRDQVDLVDDDPVGKGHLPLGLVDDAGGLLLVEVLLEVLGVDDGDDRIEVEIALELIVQPERRGQRT
jgi:hypothetical protein